MMSKQTAATMTLVLALGGLSVPRAASGQLPSASTAALATANNYTALARGFTAIALNPAGLGMPGNPGFSFSFPTLPVELGLGLNALTISDVNAVEGLALPDSTRDAWLTSVNAEEGLTARAGLAITEFALSVGPVGFQVSTVAQADATMAPDAFELAMYGNAGRAGTARDMTLDGTDVNGWAATTFAVALGIPLPDVQNGTFAAGATLKYTLGHVVVTGGDDGTSVIRSNPIMLDLSLPSIAPDSFTVNNGTGVGLDLGVAWEDSTWAVAASIQNVFHTFQWNLDAYAYRPGELIVDGTSISDDFDAVPAAGAPVALQDTVLAQSFDPVLILGAAYRVSEKLAVTADLRKDTGEALVLGNGSHVGLGVEFRAISFLALRGGMARAGGAGQFAAGFGLVLGPVNLSGAYLTETGPGDFKAASFALSFGHH